MQIAGAKELMEQVRNQDLCTVCGGCVGLCPYHKVYQGKVAMIFDCDLAQGSCYAHCPKTDVDHEELSQKYFDTEFVDTPLGFYREIKAAKAGEKLVNGSFQNGGVATALMTLALKTGLINAAILTDSADNIPVPRLVTKSEAVVQCSSTKYMAAPTVSCFNQAVQDGFEKIGMVGTACQLKAVAKMRCNPLDKEDFRDPTALTVGLFCTWALDTRKFLEFLSNRVNIAEIVSMDVPPPPAEIFVINTANEKHSIPLDEIRTMIPKGCTNCSDMTAEWSDLSVGSFEGKPAWNTLIIRTEKGQKLVDLAVAEGYLVLNEFPSTSLDHLISGAVNKKKRIQNHTTQEEK
jgi:coenzyme F420 hydrogenase subunit beta